MVFFSGFLDFCVGERDEEENKRAQLISKKKKIEQVETLFHECGHALQHTLTKQDDGLVSGIRNVEWDAVELPSQWYERKRFFFFEVFLFFSSFFPLPPNLFRSPHLIFSHFFPPREKKNEKNLFRMEDWCYDRKTIDTMAVHYSDGTPLPDELFEKILKARTYRAGSMVRRELVFFFSFCF